MKRYFMPVLLFSLFTIYLVGFQNCASNVKFSSVGHDSSKISIDTKPCIDQDGALHEEGSTWSTSTDSVVQLSCPDAPSRPQKYKSTQGFICESSEIRPTDFSTVPVDSVANCPAPKLEAHLTPVMPKEGETAKLVVTTEYVSEVKYNCMELSGGIALSGVLRSGTTDEVPIVITRDLTCGIEAKNSEGVTLNALVQVPVDCGQRVKENGQCRDFECKSVQILAATDGKYIVPARTAAGVCYSIKLVNSIASSSSTLTSTVDNEVVSRNHNSGGTPTRNSYQLGKSDLDFFLQGKRNIRLAGGTSATAPILVDNFILVGFIPPTLTSSVESYYKSYGTSDSTLPSTDYITFRSTPIVLSPFGSAGTSTIAPLDVTANVISNQDFHLDFRALDCGGTRELSNVYLLFQ